MNSGLISGLASAPLRTARLRPSRYGGLEALGGTASGTNSFAVGANSIASGANSVAFGGGNISSSGGVAFGGGQLRDISSILIGQGVAAIGSMATTRDGGNSSATGRASIAWGNGSLASDLDTFALGEVCYATVRSAIATGSYALSYRQAMKSHSCGIFAALGDAQSVLLVLRNKTTNDTATTLFLDGSSSRLTIPSGKVFSFIAQITGIKSDGSAVAKYIREGTIKNVGGTTTLAGSIITIGTDHEDNASTDVTITADDTNDALDISVTGIAAETWRWVAVVQGVEIAYGT
jgi:hypothetical protein